jgi:hypothetical protein
VNWYGLNWTDIIVNVTVLAILPGIVGALGGHLAAEGLRDEKHGEPAKEISLPVTNGDISLTLSRRVVRNIVPRDGSLWIRICDRCIFIGNMAGFLEDKDDPHMRSIAFRILYTGRVVLSRMTANTGFPAGAATVPVGFFYACANCKPLDPKKPQPLTAKVVYPTLQ